MSREASRRDESALRGSDRQDLPAMPALAPATVLGGRFRLVQAIGRGGFGQVWRAEELLPNGSAIRHVALKLLSPQSDLAAWADEAKLLASFSHPSLVTILAAGLLSIEPAGGSSVLELPFVAMELLSGETLAAVFARHGPLPWRRVLAWARHVAAALDVIHARGIVHLDLKPSNLFLTEDGVLKVLDFGISRRTGASFTPAAALKGADPAVATAEFLAGWPGRADGSPASERDVLLRADKTRSAASVVGTPGFIAPEVIEQRAATAAADAYALASCVVQLVTGRLPQDVAAAPPDSADPAARLAYWAELRDATIAGRLRDIEAPPVRAQHMPPDLRDVPLPRGVAAMCRRLLSLDPAERGVAPGKLAATLDAAWQRPYGIPEPPYLGLSAFGPEQEGMLFGRDDDVTRLARELSAHPVLVLQGISGSGKSSLAMAGIIPAIARKDAVSGPDWRTLVVRPGVDPDLALSNALQALHPDLGEATPQSLAAFCRVHGIAAALVFDQLEEIITQAAQQRCARFVAFLASAAEIAPSAPVRVVATLREDFTSGLLSIEPLGERLRDALRFVGPPTTAAVREIVAQPAELAGVRIEGIAEIAADVQRELREGDGRLPLVALALSALWPTRRDGLLSADKFREMGGVRKIFDSFADGIFSRLDDAAQVEARAMLTELCHDNLARRSVSRDELRARARNPEAFDRAVTTFIDAKLVVETAGALEVVHEFLFTAWDRLSGWLADARAGRRIVVALREAAQLWRDLGRPEGNLPGPSEVALAKLALAEGTADAALLEDWLKAEADRARARRSRRIALAAGSLALLTLAFAAWGLTVSEAQRRADEAKIEATMAAERAREHERRAIVAKEMAAKAEEDANRSRQEKERAAAIAQAQQEAFDRLLRDAESELQKTRIRCTVLQNEPKIREGGCPPGDPLCSDTGSGKAQRIPTGSSRPWSKGP